MLRNLPTKPPILSTFRNSHIGPKAYAERERDIYIYMYIRIYIYVLYIYVYIYIYMYTGIISGFLGLSLAIYGNHAEKLPNVGSFPFTVTVLERGLINDCSDSRYPQWYV